MAWESRQGEELASTPLPALPSGLTDEDRKRIRQVEPNQTEEDIDIERAYTHQS